MRPLASRFLLWRFPAAVAVAATIVFAAGFWLALRGASGAPLGAPPGSPPPATKPTLPTSGRILLVLGDSLARGTGGESGRGFAREVLEGLKRRGAAEIANLAVNGAESDEVRELVSHENVRTLAANAGWILVSAGGNDLSHAVPRAADGPAAPVESVTRARDRFAGNLREILDALRAANPRAPIRVLGLYDPFEGPDPAARLGASVVARWNGVAQEVTLEYPDVVLVATFDLFEGRPDRLALDHFHPNREGYSAIAARVLQTIP